MRETPGADTFAPHEWARQAAASREEGLPPPDRGQFLRDALEAGWTPWEPLHRELFEWFGAARYGAKTPAMTQALADVSWPWCAKSLQDHVGIIAHHWAEHERIGLEEHSQRARR